MESRYLNREISLLDFQERVLALAVNSAVPLLERAKFIAIVSQNLDEFFQVRVAGLKEQVLSGVTSTSPDGLTPRSQLTAIHRRVSELAARRDRYFTDELLPLLEAEHIQLTNWEGLTPDDQKHLVQVFEQQIYPVLTPLAVDPSHPFPFISNLSLNLAVLVKRPKRDEPQFARIKVPPILPRFIVLPDGQRFVPLEQVIAAHLEQLFAGMQVLAHYPFRVIRNAELAIEEEEAGDLLETMENVLRLRHFSARAVRLEVAAGTAPDVVEFLRTELRLEPEDVYEAMAPLDLGGLWALHGLQRHELKEPAWTPQTMPAFSRPSGEDLDYFEVIKQGDLLVHHPYESFTTSTGAFLAQAARDPRVLAIKQTLYRTSLPDDLALGGEAGIVRSLISAAQAGKQVVVLVELKARFDEEANINWARMLEEAGCHVVYGVSELKTHSKILLVVRREDDGLVRYSHVGTGNYNPKTARLYEDMALFTADPQVGSDLTELFNVLTGYSRTKKFRRLLVAPTTLRSGISKLIRKEAAKGPEGRIVFKLNHLIDPQVIDELYEASQAGVQIDLVVRGLCGIKPGVPGLSETIRVKSLVGRYLEHSRLYRFGDPSAEPVYYMGSADMMPRNLNRRVEALVRVTDPGLQKRLERVLTVALDDDVLAWDLHGDGSWTKVPPGNGINSQAELERAAQKRSRG